MRKRAAWLTPIQHTKSQHNLPESGKKSAYKANRAGVGARFPAPAVPQSLAVDLALIAHDDRLLRAMALTSRKTAKPHDAHPRSRLRTIPGLGALLSLGLLYASHDLHRCPRGQDYVSSCRLVTGAKASAGTRDGTSGTTSGHASLTWACSEAAVLLVCAHPPGQRALTRLEQKPAKGTACTVLAHKRARAVDDMCQRQTALDTPTCFRGARRAVGEPAASLATRGISLRARSGRVDTLAAANAQASGGPSPRSLRVDWTPTSAP
jgi:hypothetical protein